MLGLLHQNQVYQVRTRLLSIVLAKLANYDGSTALFLAKLCSFFHIMPLFFLIMLFEKIENKSKNIFSVRSRWSKRKKRNVSF